MRILTAACATLCSVAFAAADASMAQAQSTVPGAAPPPRTGPKIAPPPRGREIDKFATHTQPPTPGSGPRSVPYLGYWPSPGPKVVDDIAGPGQPPKRPDAGVGKLAGVQKPSKGPLFDPCNSSDCNEIAYQTDCDVVQGGLSSDPGGGISCNSGPVHEP